MRFILRTCLALALLAALPVLAADLTLEARLIWGANEAQTGNFKPVQPDLAAKLGGVFKWNYYYDITNVSRSIPLNQTRDFKMSDRCTLKIKNLGNSHIDISCINQGKQVSKRPGTLEANEWLVLGGNATNNTAWFVGLRPADNGLAVVKKP